MNESIFESVRFEHQLYPIVILRMPKRGSVDGVHAWYDEVERILEAATGPIGLVHDIRPVELLSMTAAHRSAVAERTTRLCKSPSARRIVADARIASNAIAAGAITAVSWLTGAVPWPQATFTDEQAAIAWTRARVEEAEGGGRGRSLGRD
jgi:hypothetical protein